jgi:transcriptional regulator with XRE-family HTH domain
MGDLTTIGPAGRRPEQAERPGRPAPLLRTLLGEVLRRARHGQRRTLADVARTARVSLPYLSELERGRKEASSEVLAAVCDALRIELSDVLAEVGRELAAQRARRLLANRAARERARREGIELPAGLPAEAAEGAEVPVVIPLDAVRRPAPAVLRPAAPGTRRPRDLNALLAA